MNTKKVIKALERWSPHGLCAGTLVDKNGVRSKTEACAVGCLALEFLHSKPGKRWLGKRDQERFVKKVLYKGLTLGDSLKRAVGEYYGFESPSVTIGDIVGLNDNIYATNDTADNNYEVKASGLPVTVARTILRLRKRFDKWIAKQSAEGEDE